MNSCNASCSASKTSRVVLVPTVASSFTPNNAVLEADIDAFIALT